eukprot:g7483.t1
MALCLWSLLVATAGAAAQRPTATLAGGGRVVGVPSSKALGVDAFLGMRYAEPPLGELRFAPPRPARTPAPGHEFDASSFGAPCIQAADPSEQPQPEAPPMAEDCLFINAWVPRRNASAPSPAPAPLRPAMVWIHGGGFVTGASSVGWYDGAALARAGGVVVFSINYRLGPLGWLKLPAAGGGGGGGSMNGLRDQVLALRWVQANAAAFGVDPARVTIFGESAGGVAVCLLCVSPLAAGLFSRAIVQSGPCTISSSAPPFQDGWGPADAAHGAAATRLLLRNLSLPTTGAGVLPALRRVDASQLVWPEPVLMDGAFPGLFADATALPGPNGTASDAARAFRAGRVNARGGVMLGSTSKDGTAAFYETDGGLWNASEGGAAAAQRQYARRMRARWGARLYARVMAQYPLSRYNGSVASAFLQADGDRTVLCPTREIAAALGRAGGAGGGVPAYHFVFAHWSLRGCDVALTPNGTNATTAASGDHYYDGMGWASHGADVPFTFGTTTGPDYYGNRSTCPWTVPAEKALSDAMQRYWASFAATGAPAAAAAPAWSPFAATAAGTTMQLSAAAPRGRYEGGGAHAVPGFKQADCAFWRSLEG